MSIDIQSVKITITEKMSPIPVAVQTNQPILITVAHGTKGQKGDDGLGVPIGGLPGQILEKKTTADNDTRWSSLEDFSLWFENQII